MLYDTPLSLSSLIFTPLKVCRDMGLIYNIPLFINKTLILNHLFIFDDNSMITEENTYLHTNVFKSLN